MKISRSQLPIRRRRCQRREDDEEEEQANDDVRVRWMIVTFVFLLITMICEESWLLKASAECTIDTSVRREDEEKKTNLNAVKPTRI